MLLSTLPAISPAVVDDITKVVPPPLTTADHTNSQSVTSSSIAAAEVPFNDYNIFSAGKFNTQELIDSVSGYIQSQGVDSIADSMIDSPPAHTHSYTPPHVPSSMPSSMHTAEFQGRPDYSNPANRPYPFSAADLQTPPSLASPPTFHVHHQDRRNTCEPALPPSLDFSEVFQHKPAGHDVEKYASVAMIERSIVQEALEYNLHRDTPGSSKPEVTRSSSNFSTISTAEMGHGSVSAIPTNSTIPKMQYMTTNLDLIASRTGEEFYSCANNSYTQCSSMEPDNQPDVDFSSDFYNELQSLPNVSSSTKFAHSSSSQNKFVGHQMKSNKHQEQQNTCNASISANNSMLSETNNHIPFQQYVGVTNEQQKRRFETSDWTAKARTVPDAPFTGIPSQYLENISPAPPNYDMDLRFSTAAAQPMHSVTINTSSLPGEHDSAIMNISPVSGNDAQLTQSMLFSTNHHQLADKSNK